MSALAARAEHARLQRLLGALPPGLDAMPAELLRHLRVAIEERCAAHHRASLVRLARIAAWLPDILLVLLVRWRLSPLLTARLIPWLPAERVARLASRLPPPLLADIASRLDSRAVRDLVRLLPATRLLVIADVLLARGDAMTLGRFVARVPDAVVTAVAERVSGEAALLEIVYFIDHPGRIDHLLQQLPPARITRALGLLSDPGQRAVWPLLLALVSHAGPGWQRILGEMAAAQGEAVLNAIIQVAHEESLWEDLLPVVGNLSPEVQRRVVTLDALMAHDVLAGIVRCIDTLGLWPVMLDVASAMTPAGRDLLAEVLAPQPRAVFARILQAALLRPAWPLICDILRRLPARQDEARELLQACRRQLDAATAGALARHWEASGLGVLEAA